MKLGDRMIFYRAKHKLTQSQLDDLLGEHHGTTFRIENCVHDTQKARRLRIELKMNELEEKQDVQM